MIPPEIQQLAAKRIVPHASSNYGVHQTKPTTQLISIIFSAILLAAVTGTTQPAVAHAATDDPRPCAGNPGKAGTLPSEGHINIINVKTGAKYANFNHGPDWEVSGTYPETLSISRSLTYTNTYESSVTVSVETVSQALGFSVSKSISTQVGATFPVPNDGKYWVLQAGTQDFPIKFDVAMRCGGSRGNVVVGHGTAVKTGRVITRNVPSS